MTAVKFAREILSALAEAHRHEIVHRDIKPHNVIVSPNWQIKVTDFGIARSGASQMTEVGSIVGTAQYLSPEQARGAPVDQRSDLYSLGIVLYEMLTGKVPFTGDAAVEIAMKHLTAIPDPPSKLRPEIPRDLDAVVMRALAKDPAQRYASAEEMDADLARVARGAGVSARTEEAMTQVLGATALGATALAAAPTVAGEAPGSDSPVPPAYRPTQLRPVPPPPKRSRWPAVIALCALLIAAAGAYLIYDHVAPILAGSNTVVVPSVIGVQYSGARTTLHQLGLYTHQRRQPDAGVAAGAVISQIPLSGKRVAKHSTVFLRVSSGLPVVAVPTLTGMSQSRAVAALAHLDLKPRLFFHTSTSAPVGTVTGTAPPAGRSIPIETPVTLSISTGPPQVGVPNIVGQPSANAVSALKGAGFVPVTVSVYSSSTPVGQVSSQYPSGGTLERPNTTVTLYVSKGPKTATVPNVIGDDERDAYQYLTQQGFTVAVVHESVTLGQQAGLVLKQTPGPNATVPAGGTVTITVGTLVTPPPPPPTPTTQTTTTSQTTPTTTTPTTPATTTTTPGTATTGAVATPSATPPAQTTPTTTIPTTPSTTTPTPPSTQTTGP
jgi:serine/threonine-protein kinase